MQPNRYENSNHYLENFSKSKHNDEVDMYTIERTNAITPTSWFYKMHNHSDQIQKETDLNLLLTLENTV